MIIPRCKKCSRPLPMVAAFPGQEYHYACFDCHLAYTHDFEGTHECSAPQKHIIGWPFGRFDPAYFVAGVMAGPNARGMI
jgi:hypothetical protein